jgi:hypothetical protein
MVLISGCPSLCLLALDCSGFGVFLTAETTIRKRYRPVNEHVVGAPKEFKVSDRGINKQKAHTFNVARKTFGSSPKK